MIFLKTTAIATIPVIEFKTDTFDYFHIINLVYFSKNTCFEIEN